MKDLTGDCGKWRMQGVGIFKGQEVRYMPPSAERVPFLKQNVETRLNFANRP